MNDRDDHSTESLKHETADSIFLATSSTNDITIIPFVVVAAAAADDDDDDDDNDRNNVVIMNTKHYELIRRKQRYQSS